MYSIRNKMKYFGDNSNLHGVGRVFSSSHIPFAKRLFWFFILICCGLGAAAILQESLQLYLQGAVSFTVETNYLTWNTPFPSLTICEQLDNDRIKSYMKERHLPTALFNFLKDVTFWNPKYCKSCSRCAMNRTCIENFIEHVATIRLKCPELLSDCWWAGKPFQCCDRFRPISTEFSRFRPISTEFSRFRPISTEYGTCFVFNSALTSNDTTLVVNRNVGLPKLVFTAKEYVFIRVHSPHDRVSVALENTLGSNSLLIPDTDFDAILKAEETISGVSVRSLPQDLRGCLYKNERPTFAQHWPFEEYANSACMLYCRAMAQVQICNCTHHFMPRLGKYPTCDINGLLCLHERKDSLLSECACPMACEEVQYKVVHVFSKRHKPQEVQSLESRVSVRLSQLPTLRVRRQANRELLGVVVDFGGVVGVFFGASLLSFIEIVYLLCLRR